MSYNGIQLHIKLGYNQVSNFWVKKYLFIFPYDQHKNYTFGPSKQHFTYVYCQTCPMAYKFQIKIISQKNLATVAYFYFLIYFYQILTTFNKSEVAHDNWKKLKTIYRFQLVLNRPEYFNQVIQKYLLWQSVPVRYCRITGVKQMIIHFHIDSYAKTLPEGGNYLGIDNWQKKYTKFFQSSFIITM